MWLRISWAKRPAYGPDKDCEDGTMLWFKFIIGLMSFELVSILFAIVLDYGNEYKIKENKNWTSF